MDANSTIAFFASLLNTLLLNANNINVGSLIVNNLQVTSVSPDCPLFSDASSNVISQGPMTDGQLIIGNTGNLPTLGSLLGTANQITVTGSAGSITLSLPSAVTTGSLTLSNTTNQLTLGTTNTTTISSVAPSASRTVTLPDVGANSRFWLIDTASQKSLDGPYVFEDATNKNFSAGSSSFLVGGTPTNCICIGNGADVSSTTSNNRIVLGQGAVSTTNNSVCLGNTSNKSVYSLGSSDLGSSAHRFVDEYLSGNINTTSSLAVNYPLQTASISTLGGVYVGDSLDTENALTVHKTTNQLVLGQSSGGQAVTINAVAPASSRTYRFVDAGGNADVVLTEGAQTLNGAIKLTTALEITPTTNQIAFGASPNVTQANFPASVGAVTLTFPNTTCTIAKTVSDTFTTPTINGSTLSVDDTGSAFNLNLTSNSNPVLTADKTLTFDVNNGNRTLDLTGNLTIANNFVTSGNNSLTLTTTGPTNVTLPTSGTLAMTVSDTFTTPTINGATLSLDDTNSAFNLNLVSLSNPALTTNRNLTFDVNNANRLIDITGNLVLASDLTTSGANTLTLTTTNITNVTLPVSGTLATLAGAEALTNKTITGCTLSVDDTGSAFNLNITSNSNPVLTADKTLTFDVNNGNRTLDLTGNLTIANDLITSGNNSVTLTSTGSTNVTLPTTGTLATLAGSEVLTNKTLTTPIIASTNSSQALTVASVTDSSSSTTGGLIASGGIGCAKNLYVGTSLFLPTTGGTPAGMSAYEEYSASVSFTGPFTQSATITINQVGKVVTITWPDIQASSGSTVALQNTSAVPARFQPSADKWFTGRGINNGTPVTLLIRVTSGGTLNFSANVAGNGWTSGASSSGPYGGACTYNL